MITLTQTTHTEITGPRSVRINGVEMTEDQINTMVRWLTFSDTTEVQLDAKTTVKRVKMVAWERRQLATRLQSTLAAAQRNEEKPCTTETRSL